jgi:hypothetical protein
VFILNKNPHLRGCSFAGAFLLLRIATRASSGPEARLRKNNVMHLLKHVTLFFAVTAAAVHAQPASSTTTNPGGSGANGVRAAAVFELPRLKANAKADDTAAVDKGRATVHELAANGKPTARAAIAQNVSFVEIDPDTSWPSLVRGGAKDITFVSFFVYASPGTSIDIAGAKIVVRASSKPDNVQMQIGRPGAKGMQWRNFGGPVRLERYGGRSLAALPVLTARLDGTAGIWDLYVGSRLGAADLPLPKLPSGATKQFSLHAGSDGARVCGLISSDDNPLFEDENRNGIDDAFERQQNPNAPLATRNSGSARSQLAQAWQQDQQARQVQPWAVQRPLPDAPAGTGKR